LCHVQCLILSLLHQICPLDTIAFEECDVGSLLISAEQAQTHVVNGEETAPAPVPNKTRRPLNLPFRRKKGRRPPKDAANGTKENDKESESM